MSSTIFHTRSTLYARASTIKVACMENRTDSNLMWAGYKWEGGARLGALRFVYAWLLGVQEMSVSLAVIPLMLLSFPTEVSISSSWLKPLNEATISYSPGMR